MYQPQIDSKYERKEKDPRGCSYGIVLCFKSGMTREQIVAAFSKLPKEFLESIDEKLSGQYPSRFAPEYGGPVFYVP